MGNVFRQGDHICALYETESERVAIATEYIADGLRRGERCFYVAESAAGLARLRGALVRLGLDAEDMVKRGALVEATHAEAHLVDGRFDCERMMRLLNEAVESALEGGFSGLRTCGDMSWLLEEAPGSEQVVAYEAFLNEFFEGVPAEGMCQYDRHRLPAGLIDHALATHSSTVFERRHKVNPFYSPPSIAASRTAHAPDVAWKLSELRRRP